MSDLPERPVRARKPASSISVVMAARNAAADIQAALLPLIAMRERREIVDIVVVDDASADRTARLAEQAGVDRVVRLAECRGPAGGRNAGAIGCGGDLLWFVDADVVVADDAARVLANAWDALAVDAVFGSYGHQPTAPNFLSQYKNLVHHDTHQRWAGPASTFWTGCGAVRRSAFEAIGGFDETHFRHTGMEDIDLGYRLRDAGYRIELVPELQGEHRKRWTLFNLLRVEIFHRALPWSRLLLSHPDAKHTLNMDDGERARALVAGIATLGLLAAASPWASWPWAAAGIVLVLLANRRLLGFFARKRGTVFALRAIAFHQIYYLYSGTTFVFAWLEHQLARTTR